MSEENYTNKLIDFLFKYEMLINEFKTIYPMYKYNSKNPEINMMYSKIKNQINDVYLSLDSLNTDIENNIINKENKLENMNKEIDESKKYYNTYKPQLQEVISKIKGDVPREKQYEYRLNNKYIDFTYLLSLLTLLGYFFYKLLY
jgi:DNA repair ATPase RecN